MSWSKFDKDCGLRVALSDSAKAWIPQRGTDGCNCVRNLARGVAFAGNGMMPRTGEPFVLTHTLEAGYRVRVFGTWGDAERYFDEFTSVQTAEEVLAEAAEDRKKEKGEQVAREMMAELQMRHALVVLDANGDEMDMN